MLGFGCMRLPMLGGAEGVVDLDQFTKMIDLYMRAGFNYFDTARVYIQGQSELAIRECLVKRYPRDTFILTDKLSGSQFQSEADIVPLFESQLQSCGVEFFDYYLMHSLSAEVYQKFLSCNAFNVISELKKRGKLKHFGISFHDKAYVLDRILSDHPEIEIVQIQLNYLDIDSPSVESMNVYNVCRKYNKPVLVMEPVKGGVLAQLPDSAADVFRQLRNGSPANYAIRYAASFDGIFKVLSGMSTLEQVQSNTECMQNFMPITASELSAIDKVKTILKQENAIQCTGCRYCVAGCPMNILIPDLFACANSMKRYGDWSSNFYYGQHTFGHGKPQDCIGCKKCEKTCPQHLEIPRLLSEIINLFE